MAQQVKDLRFECKDLNLMPRNPCKYWAVGHQGLLVIPAERKWRWHYQNKMDSPRSSSEVWVQMRDLAPTNRWTMIEKGNQLQLLASTCTHMWKHTHIAHASTHTHRYAHYIHIHMKKKTVLKPLMLLSIF